MTAKMILEEALKLPKRQRLKIAEELFESTVDPEESAALMDGAKRAHDRIKACRGGKMETHAEEDILDLLAQEKRR